MKSFLVLTALVFSFSIFANETKTQPELCWSHGQCQTSSPLEGMRCFIVKTGTSSTGTTACSVRCHKVILGSLCEPVQGHVFGICKAEHYPIPAFDPNDCSAAIDPADLP